MGPERRRAGEQKPVSLDQRPSKVPTGTVSEQAGVPAARPGGFLKSHREVGLTSSPPRPPTRRLFAPISLTWGVRPGPQFLTREPTCTAPHGGPVPPVCPPASGSNRLPSLKGHPPPSPFTWKPDDLEASVAVTYAPTCALNTTSPSPTEITSPHGRPDVVNPPPNRPEKVGNTKFSMDNIQ